MENFRKDIITLDIIHDLKSYLDDCLMTVDTFFITSYRIARLSELFNSKKIEKNFENWIIIRNDDSTYENTFTVKEQNYDLYQKELEFEIDMNANKVIFKKIIFNKLDYEKNLHFIYYFYEDMFGFSVTCLRSNIFTGFTCEDGTINTFIDTISPHEDVNIKQSDYSLYSHNEAFTKLLRLHLLASNKTNIKVMERLFYSIFQNKPITQQYADEISILYDISVNDFFEDSFIFEN